MNIKKARGGVALLYSMAEESLLRKATLKKAGFTQNTGGFTHWRISLNSTGECDHMM